MTPEQRKKLACLARCTMLPGSWDKRFVRDMGGRPDDHEPTPRQAEMIEHLWHRYRRQLAKAVTPADGLAVPPVESEAR